MPPFRSDVDALEARHAVLEAELADKVRARDEAACMLAEARARERGAAETANHVARGHARRRRRVVFGFVGVMMFALGIVLVARVDDQREDRARGYQMIRMLVEFEAFTNQICACPDVACTHELHDGMRRWIRELAVARDDTSDLQRQKKWMATAKRMASCVDKLRAASASPGVLDR